MPNKRKDNKGRLLRTGESQRKDLTYMYRYTDMRGKRQCVYADDLNKLREKEKKIQLDTLQGLDISGGGITVQQDTPANIFPLSLKIRKSAKTNVKNKLGKNHRDSCKPFTCNKVYNKYPTNVVS